MNSFAGGNHSKCWDIFFLNVFDSLNVVSKADSKIFNTLDFKIYLNPIKILTPSDFGAYSV